MKPARAAWARGAFMTDAFELDDDVGKYTFLFREVKINHAGGYQKVYGGVWSAAAREVNAVTEVDAYNEADVVIGGGTEFKGLFQVKLDKEYCRPPKRRSTTGRRA